MDKETHNIVSKFRVPLVIPQLYRPTQPLLEKPQEGIAYNVYPCDPRLRSFVSHYWEVKTTQELPLPYFFRAVADGSTNIAFIPGDSSFNILSGFYDKNVEFSLGTSFRFMGICFYPSMFSAMFRCDMSELTGQTVKLEEVFPRTADFLNKSISPEQDLGTMLKYLDFHLLDVLFSGFLDFNGVFFSAVDNIYKNKGAFHPEKDLDLGVSSRHLRRLFNQYIGDSPKAFSNVIRFQNILKSRPSVQFLKESKIFYDLGYYDQSHFIKEFKRFSGFTPGDFFDL